jgi:hypothetical protein
MVLPLYLEGLVGAATIRLETPAEHQETLLAPLLLKATTAEMEALLPQPILRAVVVEVLVG